MPEVLIVGQGLAGTMLGWALERAGVSFDIADPGRGDAASLIAAGLINPISGQRLVKSWRIEALLPVAREIYRSIGETLGRPVWRDLRIRRLFATERERAIWATKRVTGELTPFAGESDDDGFWIEQGGRVEVPALLAALRQRWIAAGRLRAECIRPEDELTDYDVVTDCRGLAGATAGRCAAAGWEFSKGEVLEVDTARLEPSVALKREHALVPVGLNRAWIGATHESGICDTTPTPAARSKLAASVRAFCNDDVLVQAHRAAIRVNVPDKRPVAGRCPDLPRLGLINALGAKGALWAPFLADAWVRHLTTGAPFDRDIDFARRA